MEEIYPTGEWLPLGNVFYRREHIYDMKWQTEMRIEDNIVESCSGGGAIASTRNLNKLVQHKFGSIMPALSTYRADGLKLASVPLNDLEVESFHWSDREHLYVVAKNGVIHCLTAILEPVTEPLELERSIRERGIVRSVFFDNGLVMLVKGGKLLYYRDLVFPKINFLQDPTPLQGKDPTMMLVLSPRISHSMELSVVFGMEDGKLFTVQGNSIRVHDNIVLSGVPVMGSVQKATGWMAIWVNKPDEEAEASEEDEPVTKGKNDNIGKGKKKKMDKGKDKGKEGPKPVGSQNFGFGEENNDGNKGETEEGIDLDFLSLGNQDVNMPKDGHGEIWIFGPEMDMKMKPAEFNRKPPDNICWVGRDCVAVSWDCTVLLVGPDGLRLFVDMTPEEHNDIGMDGNLFVTRSEAPVVHLSQEVDGLRIISPTEHVFLHRVDDPVIQTVAIGSVESSALLLQAYFANREGATGAEELRRVILNRGQEPGMPSSGLNNSMSLLSACRTLISASRGENSTEWQRAFLHAASYGRVYCTDVDERAMVDNSVRTRFLNGRRNETTRDFFTRTSNELRIISHISTVSEAGSLAIPMTCAELDNLGPEQFIERLIARREFYVAWQVCNLLDVSEPKENLIVKWAIAKINVLSNPSEEKLADEILKKFKFVPGVSMHEVVKVAHNRSFMLLAGRLLENEPIVANRVSMYLEMGEYEKALEVAREACNQELEEEVLLEAKNNLCNNNLDEFAEWLVKNENTANRAATTFLNYARRISNDLFTEMAVKVNKAEEAIEGTMRAFFNAKNTQTRKNRITAVEDACKTRFNDSELALIFGDSLTLLNNQDELSPAIDRQLLGLSVDDTLLALMKSGQQKKAEELGKSLSVSQLRWQFINIKYFAYNQAWRDLEKYADSCKPTSWWPFFEACKNNNAYKQALVFARRMPDARDRVRAMLQIEEYQTAVDECAQIEDVYDLHMVLRELKAKKAQLCIKKVIDHRNGKQ